MLLLFSFFDISVRSWQNFPGGAREWTWIWISVSKTEILSIATLSPWYRMHIPANDPRKTQKPEESYHPWHMKYKCQIYYERCWRKEQKHSNKWLWEHTLDKVRKPTIWIQCMSGPRIHFIYQSKREVRVIWTLKGSVVTALCRTYVTVRYAITKLSFLVTMGLMNLEKNRGQVEVLYQWKWNVGRIIEMQREF